MYETPPTRPQQSYIPPVSQPQFTPNAPHYGPAPSYLSPPPPQQAPRKGWSTRGKLLAAGGAAIVGLGVYLGVAYRTPSQPAYVAQLQGDGYNLVSQNKLTGGEGVGYASGSLGTGASEIVLQTKSAADAQAVENSSMNGGAGNAGLTTVTTQGDLVVMKASNYAAVQEIITTYHW